MSNALLGALGFALVLFSALAFLDLMFEFPVIALASLAFVALTAGGYEITRRKANKP